MRYFTAEELKSKNREDAHSILEKCSGHMVKLNFGIKVFQEWRQRIFNGQKDIRTLDLGTASGGFSAQLKQLGYDNLYGVDIDNYLAPENKSLYQEFKAIDLSHDKIPWPDNYFQIVIGWCILPHLENPFHCLREIYRVLDKGGLFIFSAPHLTSKPAIDYFIKHKDFGSYRATNNHLVLFTPAIIKKAVLKYFDLLEINYSAVRPKIFQIQKGGFKAKLRELIYKIAEKYSPSLQKWLGHRWAYDAIYVVQKTK